MRSVSSSFSTQLSCLGVSFGLFLALKSNIPTVCPKFILTRYPALRYLYPLDAEYTYSGDDYPIEYPIGLLDPVAMTLHESIHFDLNGSDPLALSEWQLLPSIPKGIGRTRLGPNYRVFVLTFHHQMHCLHRMQRGLIDRSDPGINEAHIRHCLNYLRQTMMCEAADSLEDGDFMGKNLEEDRRGDEIICRDWERVYDVMDERYEEWLVYRKKFGI